MDKLTTAARSQNMARIKSKNTKPEKQVRSLLHGMGYRFRLHDKRFPGTPDIILPRYKVVIFVNGCFWHGHEGCKRATIPASNAQFWQEKIAGNRERDRRNIILLENIGYRCLVIWQCELNDEEALKKRIIDFVGNR